MGSHQEVDAAQRHKVTHSSRQFGSVQPKRGLVGRDGVFATLIRLILWFIIGVSFAAYFVFLLVKPSVWLAKGHKWGDKSIGFQIYYHFQASRVSKKLADSSGAIFNNVVLQVLPVLSAAVCAILLFKFRSLSRKKDTQSQIYRLKIQAKRILFFQLYPRRFWSWWCGGLHVLDLLLVMTWMVINMLWVYLTVLPKINNINLQIHQKKVTLHAARLNKFKQTVSAVGTASQFSMAMLFFPLPRNTFLHYVFNTDFSGLLKYHRWLGHGFSLLVLGHGLAFYIYWAIIPHSMGSFAHNFFLWGKDHSNNLAGSISIAFLLVLYLSSGYWVRRLYYQVFVRLHIISFVGFMIFTYIHYWQRWRFMSASLTLLILDWLFRMVQWAHPSFVRGQFVTADKSIITLNFTWRKSARPQPGQYIFLNTPTGRRWQYHPVTVADVDESQPGITLVTAHMKCYGNWTKDMVAQMLDKGKCLMRVDGPYGVPGGPGWHKYDALVIIAGGIGATPMLGMLREMALFHKQLTAHAKGDEYRVTGHFPRKVYLHWACRGMAEFALMDEHLIETSLEKLSWLSINLYTTRHVDAEGVRNEPFSHEEEINKLVHHEKQMKFRAPLTVGHKHPSSFFFRPGPLEGYGSGFYWAIAHILAFFGLFFCMLMASTYDTNLALLGKNNQANWKTAILTLVGTFVGAFGLPALLVYPFVFIRRMWRPPYMPCSHSGFDARQADQRPAIMTAEHKVGHAEDGSLIPVGSGRPDVRQILSDVASQNADLGSVGVFVAGPQAMVKEVRLGCANLNDSWKAPYLDFSSHSFDL